MQRSAGSRPPGDSGASSRDRSAALTYLDRVEFRVLGPLEVIHNDTAAAPSGAKERAILARLLLEPARVVAADALLEAAWPGADPRAATRSLGVRLANLRAFLEPARPAGRPSTLLVRDGHGYRLVADPEQVDAVRLERLVRDATTLAPADALTRYETALALWRGAPFGDLAYAEFAQAEIRRLEELRVRAAEGRARALVELGRHEEALPELQRLAAAEPLREELARALALALYRCGRQVDALAALRALGTDLSALGLEPGTDTRELERAILLHDRSLACPAPVVRRLPKRASRFIGREEDLAHAERLVAESPLVTIAGTGGAGKTRLALELAGRHADAWWCELAPVADDADVAGAIAEVLGDARPRTARARQLRARARRRGRRRRGASLPLPRPPHPRHQPRPAGRRRRAGAAPLRPRAGRRRRPVRRPRAGGGRDRRPPRGRRAVPAARRPAAGDRARGRPHALDGARRDRRAARRAVQPADGAGPPRGRPPLDPARRDRLVVRAARRAAAAAVRAAVGVRARLRARRRGGGVRGRRRRPRAGGVAARRAGVQLAGRRSASSVGGRATPCSRRCASTAPSGWRRAASRNGSPSATRITTSPARDG